MPASSSPKSHSRPHSKSVYQYPHPHPAQRAQPPSNSGPLPASYSPSTSRSSTSRSSSFSNSYSQPRSSLATVDGPHPYTYDVLRSDRRGHGEERLRNYHSQLSYDRDEAEYSNERRGYPSRDGRHHQGPYHDTSMGITVSDDEEDDASDGSGEDLSIAGGGRDVHARLGGGAGGMGMGADDDNTPLSGAPSGKKHVCPTCFKRFNRPSSLKIHVNTHTGATRESISTFV